MTLRPPTTDETLEHLQRLCVDVIVTAMRLEWQNGPGWLCDLDDDNDDDDDDDDDDEDDDDDCDDWLIDCVCQSFIHKTFFTAN